MNSIKDIAAKAKVSAGTVDRVIHNRGGVSEKTKQKILQIIQENNYTVNPVASILASKKTFTIATLFPSPNDTNDFWQTPKQGVLDAAKEIKSLSFEVLNFEFDQFDPISYQKAFNLMLKSKPNAVLIAPILHQESLKSIKKLEETETPYVTINAETKELNNLSFIGQNAHKAGFLAGKLFYWVLPLDTEILIVEIKRDLANHTVINNRIKGFKDYLNLNNKNIQISHLVIDNDKLETEKELNAILDNYLQDKIKIKGIFVPSSKSHHIAKSLETINRTDIEIGGFDTTTKNIQYLKNDTIDFLISQKPYQQGYEGIKILFNYLIHKKKPQQNYYLPIEVVFKENVEYL